MQNPWLNGVPKGRDYQLLIESSEFKELEIFSEEFLLANKKALGSYAKRWVGDPMHQWSRQWEYPYVMNSIQPIVKSKETTRILDAGSGVTFFPYYIGSNYSSAKIHCADYDKNLADVYHKINSFSKCSVDFTCSDLRKLPYEDSWFDIIYCISVLEHTDDYEEIIEIFHRILRPGGKLVITFDISLDGTRDISVERGTILLQSLAKRFDLVDDISLDLKSHLSTPDIFTTHTAKDINPKLLPWKFPSFLYRLKSLIANKPFGTWPPALTVFCLSLTRRSD